MSLRSPRFVQRAILFWLSILAATLAPVAARAGVVTMAATYYTIGETDQDTNHLAIGVFNNEVQSTLGVDGLPILNTAPYGCTSNCFTATPLPADLTASGEITWWSPALNKGGSGGASDVIETGTGTVTLPYANANFYPPNAAGANDANGFQAAVFATTLVVPTTESISFSVGADDTAFVYLDGSIVCDLGGLHADSPGTCTTSVLAPGDHSLELFAADLERTGAALSFSVTTANVTGAPVPEPSTWLVFLAGLFGFGFCEFRRRRGTGTQGRA